MSARGAVGTGRSVQEINDQCDGLHVWRFDMPAERHARNRILLPHMIHDIRTNGQHTAFPVCIAVFPAVLP